MFIMEMHLVIRFRGHSRDTFHTWAGLRDWGFAEAHAALTLWPRLKKRKGAKTPSVPDI